MTIGFILNGHLVWSFFHFCQATFSLCLISFSLLRNVNTFNTVGRRETQVVEPVWVGYLLAHVCLVVSFILIIS